MMTIASGVFARICASLLAIVAALGGGYEMLRGLNGHDPRFGEALYTDRRDDGSDVAATLARITSPAVLIHTNWSYTDEGILMPALDDADRARSLIPGVEFIKVDSGHGFHFEKPAGYLKILFDFGRRRAP